METTKDIGLWFLTGEVLVGLILLGGILLYVCIKIALASLARYLNPLTHNGVKIRERGLTKEGEHQLKLRGQHVLIRLENWPEWNTLARANTSALAMFFTLHNISEWRNRRKRFFVTRMHVSVRTNNGFTQGFWMFSESGSFDADPKTWTRFLGQLRSLGVNVPEDMPRPTNITLH